MQHLTTMGHRVNALGGFPRTWKIVGRCVAEPEPEPELTSPTAALVRPHLLRGAAVAAAAAPVHVGRQPRDRHP